MKESKFNIFVDSARKGETVLYNTLYGSIAILNAKIRGVIGNMWGGHNGISGGRWLLIAAVMMLFFGLPVSAQDNKVGFAPQKVAKELEEILKTPSKRSKEKKQVSELETKLIDDGIKVSVMSAHKVGIFDQLIATVTQAAKSVSPDSLFIRTLDDLIQKADQSGKVQEEINLKKTREKAASTYRDSFEKIRSIQENKKNFIRLIKLKHFDRAKEILENSIHRIEEIQK